MASTNNPERIPRNPGPLHWSFTEGLNIIKSKYSPKVFLKATLLYALVRKDEKNILEKLSLGKIKEKVSPDFESLLEKRQVLDLVFGTLLYDRVYGEVLDARSFFYKYPELQRDTHLTIVVLHDMRKRKLLPGICDGDANPDPSVRNVENALVNTRLKIGAEFARVRIEAKALSFQSLRPAVYSRFKEPNDGSDVTIWGWVNLKRIRVQSVVENLRASGYKVYEVRNGPGSPLDLSDVVCVHTKDPYSFIQESVVKHDILVIQDISTCFGPQCLVNCLLQQCRIVLGHKYITPHDRRIASLLYTPCPPIYPQLGPWDIAVTNVGNGLVAAHLASLLYSFGFKGKILAFGAGSVDKQLRMQNNFFQMKVPGVCAIQQMLTDLSPEDNRLGRIRAVLVNPKNSASAIVDPATYLTSEGGIVSFLNGMSSDYQKPYDFTQQQLKTLSFCLKLPKVQVVVYTTQSIYEEENADVVMAAIQSAMTATQQVDMSSSCSGDAIEQELFKKTPSEMFELAAIPTNAEGLFTKSSIEQPYMFISPENGRNGCFVAAIVRKEILESFDPEAEVDSDDELMELFENECWSKPPADDEESNETESFSMLDYFKECTSSSSFFQKSTKPESPTKKDKSSRRKKKRRRKKLETRSTVEADKTKSSVSSSTTPSGNRTKANSSLSQQTGKKKHSRKTSKSEGLPLRRLESLTLQHFVAGHTNPPSNKFKLFLSAMQLPKTNVSKLNEEEIEVENEQSVVIEPRDDARGTQEESDEKEKETIRNEDELKTEMDCIQDENYIVNADKLSKLPERYDSVENNENNFMSSEEGTEYSEEKYFLDSSSCEDVKPLLGLRRRRYMRYHNLSATKPRLKPDIDHFLSKFLIPSTSRDEICKEDSQPKENFKITANSKVQGFNKDFNVYFPEKEVQKLPGVVDSTIEKYVTSLDEDKKGFRSSPTRVRREDNLKFGLWSTLNDLASKNTFISSFHGASIVTPELRLPSTFRPLSRNERLNHIYLPSQRHQMKNMSVR